MLVVIGGDSCVVGEGSVEVGELGMMEEDGLFVCVCVWVCVLVELGMKFRLLVC